MEGFDYYLDAFRRYFDFDGRSRRSAYWYFILFHALVMLTLFVCTFLIPILGVVFYFSYVALVFFPNLAVLFRRLHDTGRSGFNLLFSLIPLVGPIIVLLFLIEEGVIGPNQYGPDPKEIAEDDSYI